VTWATVFAAFVACHLGGDFLIQTEWQAVTKVQGLGTADGRRALLSHVVTYTLVFVPVLVWIATDRSVGRAIVVAVLIAVPHVLVDDGHLLSGWMRQVKHVPEPAPSLRLMVDQSFHVVCLFGAAVVAAA
jgi:hypothetical protein